VTSTPSVLVVDASALVDAVLHPRSLGDGARGLIVGARCHAPHLIDAEVGSVFRRLVLRQELKPDVAEIRLGQAALLVDVRHEMSGDLARAAWRLREEVSFYDALYVALAAALRRPLLTSDNRLAATARRHCEVIALS
jgi:predicted nucleic acid-binding protein